ncbi:MAG: aminopeptidase P family protein [Balneolales bacterium]
MHHLHRQKLTSLLSEHKNAVAYISGGTVLGRYDTDFEYPFRQESNFLYLSGVQEPDFQLLIHINSGDYHLFIPKRDARYAVWAGFIKTPEEYKAQYKPDFIHYDEDLPSVLQKMKPETVFCLNQDQAKTIRKEGHKADDNLLKDALAYCRIIKTEWELDQLRKASEVASKAHTQILEKLKPGMMEYEVKALYEYVTTSEGLIHHPYNGIYATGKSSAVLHYVDNHQKLNDGDYFLIDAGAEYNGYAADITRTHPVGGSFKPIQRDLYHITLRAQNNALKAIGPGVKMVDLHMNACRDITQGLVDINLLRGGVDELMDKNIFSLFFPHGLGHLMGLDTHDVGGYPKGVKKIERPGVKYLRARITLEPGMVLTIEPGLYMIPALLKPAFEDPEQAKYLNTSRLKELLHLGGVRIEDNVIVTEKGMENMTTVPK